MENYNFKLVDGTFNAQDARQVLFSLVNSKINYHSLEIFSLQERFDADVSHSEKRIKALTEASLDLKKVIEEAAQKNLKLKVNGTISIELV